MKIEYDVCKVIAFNVISNIVELAFYVFLD